MNKKVIRLPIDDDLLGELDEVSRNEKRSRSDLILKACRDYLRQRKNRNLDRVYEDGYTRVPEETIIGEAQLALLNQVLSEENW